MSPDPDRLSRGDSLRIPDPADDREVHRAPLLRSLSVSSSVDEIRPPVGIGKSLKRGFPPRSEIEGHEDGNDATTLSAVHTEVAVKGQHRGRRMLFDHARKASAGERSNLPMTRGASQAPSPACARPTRGARPRGPSAPAQICSFFAAGPRLSTGRRVRRELDRECSHA
jgi:hypothetical protein